jgi:hypothetical protein
MGQLDGVSGLCSHVRPFATIRMQGIIFKKLKQMKECGYENLSDSDDCLNHTGHSAALRKLLSFPCRNIFWLDLQGRSLQQTGTHCQAG